MVDSDKKAPLATSASKGECASDKQRILIVDDEKAIRRLFELILSTELPGRKIDLASNGQEAVEAFGVRHHGVLLLDLHMPVMDGQAAFTEIQKLCRLRQWEMPAVVFCTGFAPPSTLRQVLAENSAHCLLTKPVSGDVLVRTIESRLLPLDL